MATCSGKEKHADVLNILSQQAEQACKPYMEVGVSQNYAELLEQQRGEECGTV